MHREVITPDTVHKPTTYYSHAVRVNDVIYTAGQAPHTFSGEVWPMTDPEGQVRCAFENMVAVLKASRAEFRDIVRLTVLVRNSQVIPAFWKVARTYLGENTPAVTMAVVKGLAGPEYLLEFDAIVHPS
jgi:enamine deaminase RidA (YjgF/YER057c/UK114 family)